MLADSERLYHSRFYSTDFISRCHHMFCFMIRLTRSKTRRALGIQSAIIVTLLNLVMCSLHNGCSSPPKKTITPGPPIPGLNLTGGYDCVQFGFMRLKQSNNVVRGTYEGIRSNGDNGTIVGRIEGDLLWIDWVQPGDLDSAILPKRGKGWLRILARGQKLAGRWGNDESRDDGGTWTAEKSDFYE